MNASPSRAAAPSAPACGSSRPHESAAAQVAGAATYVDDIAEVRGTLHAAPILSPVAHGRLQGVDATPALAMPGVRGVVRGATAGIAGITSSSRKLYRGAGEASAASTTGRGWTQNLTLIEARPRMTASLRLICVRSRV